MAKTIKEHLKIAAKAWAGATLNIQKFADAYVNARQESEDEDAVIEAFRAAYPMFGEREWRRLWLIGSYLLLPHFMFKSDSFVGKLLKLKNNWTWQEALVSMSESGNLRVDRGNGPEEVKLSDLTAKEEKILAMLMNESDEKLSPNERLARFGVLLRKVNKNVAHKEAWQIEKGASGRKYVQFNRACRMDAGELRDILKSLETGQKRKGRSASAILNDMVSELVKYSQLRDDERDFEDSHGHRDMWTRSDDRAHDRLLDSIQKSRIKLTRLVREATGDESIEV